MKDQNAIEKTTHKMCTFNMLWYEPNFIDLVQQKILQSNFMLSQTSRKPVIAGPNFIKPVSTKICLA